MEAEAVIGGTIPLVEARRRLDELHAAEMKRGLGIVEATVQQIAAERGVPINEVRALMAPHVARQVAVMQEMHRLAQIDLVVAAEPPLRQR